MGLVFNHYKTFHVFGKNADFVYQFQMHNNENELTRSWTFPTGGTSRLICISIFIMSSNDLLYSLRSSGIIQVLNSHADKQRSPPITPHSLQKWWAQNFVMFSSARIRLESTCCRAVMWCGQCFGTAFLRINETLCFHRLVFSQEIVQDGSLWPLRLVWEPSVGGRRAGLLFRFSHQKTRLSQSRIKLWHF